MGRTYAGTLGPLAFATVVARAIVHGGASQQTLLAASMCLFGFALIGSVTGALAGWIVEDSVRSRVAAEAKAAEQEAQAAAGSAARN